jgi:non-specific serine/threonine protein kinase/serine/threonine-protein kinase
MTPARNRRIRELFDAAFGQTEEAQADLLWRECGDDEELVSAVWRLLGANRKTDEFMKKPAWATRRIESAEAAPDSMIGHYKVIKEIGKGGMGIVYQAVRADEVFRRIVAVKVIKPEFAMDTFIAVFQQERQILADLDHPNIARIVDGGSTDSGLPFFVMDYVDGVALDKFSQAHGLSVNQRLMLFRQVCKAAEYLHRNRVVHSDFKPSNILVGTDGIVKILDFGIARVLNQSATVRPELEKLLMGTLRYSSPEQLQGQPARYASDIYSLGVVLYELLTGMKPHSSENRSTEELRMVIISQDPRPPSASVKSLRGDLDAIVMKALTRDPAGRYATVTDLDTDIENFLTCRPVKARRAGVFYKTGKYFKRNPREVMNVALLVVVVLLSAALFYEWRTAKKYEERVKTTQETAIRNVSQYLSSANPSETGWTFDDAHMQDLRNVAGSYEVLFPEAIHVWPGSTPARRGLLNQAHSYLTDAGQLIDREPMNDDGVTDRRELARAWYLVGNVEGSRTAPSLKNYTEAAHSYEEAEKILSQLPDQESANLLQQVRSAESSTNR